MLCDGWCTLSSAGVKSRGPQSRRSALRCLLQRGRRAGLRIAWVNNPAGFLAGGSRTAPTPRSEIGDPALPFPARRILERKIRHNSPILSAARRSRNQTRLVGAALCLPCARAPQGVPLQEAQNVCQKNNKLRYCIAGPVVRPLRAVYPESL
jgi:hypothetical protein